eukprot:1480602-Amphidinium_carterae.1
MERVLGTAPDRIVRNSLLSALQYSLQWERSLNVVAEMTHRGCQPRALCVAACCGEMALCVSVECPLPRFGQDFVPPKQPSVVWLLRVRRQGCVCTW